MLRPVGVTNFGFAIVSGPNTEQNAGALPVHFSYTPRGTTSSILDSIALPT